MRSVDAVLLLAVGCDDFIAKRPPPPDMSQSLAACIAEKAGEVAAQVIEPNLKAPATASYGDVQFLARRQQWAFVRVAVDAQNSFGALIRSHWCVVMEFTDCGAGKFRVLPTVGVTTCDEAPTEQDIAAVFALNGWPGTEAIRDAMEKSTNRRAKKQPRAKEH